jgi:hypothetical protein
MGGAAIYTPHFILFVFLHTQYNTGLPNDITAQGGARPGTPRVGSRSTSGASSAGRPRARPSPALAQGDTVILHCCFLRIYTVILLSLLSFSAAMPESPRAILRRGPRLGLVLAGLLGSSGGVWLAEQHLAQA